MHEILICLWEAEDTADSFNILVSIYVVSEKEVKILTSVVLAKSPGGASEADKNFVRKFIGPFSRNHSFVAFDLSATKWLSMDPEGVHEAVVLRREGYEDEEREEEVMRSPEVDLGVAEGSPYSTVQE